MVKFKILQNNQRFMASILRINVEQQKKGPLKKLVDNLSIPVRMILLILFSTVVSCTVRMTSSSYDFTVRSIAAFALISTCQAITICMSMNVHLQKMVTLYQTLQAIVDSADGMILVSNYNIKLKN